MIICHIITGLNNGGAEAVLFRLATAEWPAAYRHIVISLTGRGVYADRLEASGITVCCLDMPRGKLTFSGVIKLYKLLKVLKPDLVQTWMYHADLVGGVISRLSGIRAVVWGIHNTDLDVTKTARSTRLVVRACALMSRFLCKRIACCSVVAAELHKKLGYSPEIFSIIPNGYPLDKFLPDREAGLVVRRSLNLPVTTPVIGMAARFNPQKDHENLLKSLALLKQRGYIFYCLLMGTDITQDNQSLMQGIRKSGLADEIHLLGQRHDMPAIMNAMDINVLSSAYGEAFPNVLAEAMACGRPCVTTDVGDAALIVNNTGWVVPPRNSQALADAMADALTAMRDTDAWQRRQTACRTHIADNFSLQKMVDNYQKIWEDVMVSQKTHKGVV